MRVLLLVAVFLVLTPTLWAQTVVQKRSARLGIGVNLAFLDAYWRGTKENHYGDFVESAALLARKQVLADIALAGFKTVRIPICFSAWASLDAPYHWDRPDALAAPDSLIKWALANKLTVIIDLHHVEFDGSVRGADTTARVVWLWNEIARRYRTTNTERVLFELRNEPHGLTGQAWRTQARQLIRTVRLVAPRHTLIVGFHDWNSRDALLKSTPFDDSNIIYTFHFYDPFVFTHQGTNWAGPGLNELGNIPFPANPRNVINVPAPAKGTWVESAIDNYAAEGTTDVLFHKLAAVKRWSVTKHVPVFVGEFGSFGTIDADSRCRHARAVGTALATLHLPGAWWEWNGNFGLQSAGTPQLVPCLTAPLRTSGLLKPTQ